MKKTSVQINESPDRHCVESGLSIPVDLNGTPDRQILAQEPVYTTPPNLPVPESFWRKFGQQVGSVLWPFDDLLRPSEAEMRSKKRAVTAVTRLVRHEAKQRNGHFLTERLCPEGFRRDKQSLPRVYRGCTPLRGANKSRAVSGSGGMFSLPAAHRKRASLAGYPLRRYPVPDSGCFVGDPRAHVGPHELNRVTTKAATHWRCGVHNRPKLRVLSSECSGGCPGRSGYEVSAKSACWIATGPESSPSHADAAPDQSVLTAQSNPRSDQPPSTWWVALQEVASRTWPKGCMALSHPVGG